MNKSCLGLLNLLLALCVLQSLCAQTPEPSISPTPEDSSPTANVKIDIPVVEDRDVLGVRFPHHDETGKLVLLIEADVARRLDGEKIGMENMSMEFYDEEGEKFEVELPSSTFNMESRVLTGDAGAKISRQDFTIEGKTLEFDLGKQAGRLRGNITMTIYQTDKLEP